MHNPPAAHDPDAGPALCDAAMALLVGEGIEGLDPDDVDSRAGLPAGTCRARYHSRAELLAAMFEHEATGYWEVLDTIEAEHGDDPAAALVAWMSYLLDAGRGRARALWGVMCDAATRREATMYISALLVGWDRDVAARLHLTPRQLALVLPMVEGWAMHAIMRDTTLPEREDLRRYVRALLDLTAD
ncbi:MAG TPA: TetR/AcrR family transcriptional regulator [Micromonosporaceae bacterium]|nr:TetR/AcrR family transcriptional regulator [Micromonosporaceae bacterium]